MDEQRFPVAYLINQYPKISHAFIRREICELERQRFRVLRFAVRTVDEPFGPEDLEERRRTRYLFASRRDLFALAGALLACAWHRPARLLAAARQAWQLSRPSERPLPVHLLYLAQACRLRAWLQQAGVRHLHAHFGTNTAEIALLVAELGGPGYSLTVHGPEEFDKPAALALARKLDKAIFAVAVSSFGRSQLYRHMPAPRWPRVHVVHCGLDAAFSAGEAVRLPARPVFVCVGRLCEQKGQALLVQALARLHAEGLVASLVLAGDGPMRALLEAQLAADGLAAFVRITGWIDGAAVRREIEAARALVLPSFAEGLPVAIMEAMALRRPVISTYVAGIPELIDRHSGWLVPAGDLDALVGAMRDVLLSPIARLEDMGEYGRRRVRERHAIATEAGKLGQLFLAAGGAP